MPGLFLPMASILKREIYAFHGRLPALMFPHQSREAEKVDCRTDGMLLDKHVRNRHSGVAIKSNKVVLGSLWELVLVRVKDEATKGAERPGKMEYFRLWRVL